MDGKRTIVIDTFGGVLTSSQVGAWNSGLAYINTSFGYNPFMFPGSLSWLPDVTDVTSGSVTGLVLDSVDVAGTLYAITNAGEVITMNTSGGYISTLITLSAGTPTFTAGGTIVYYNGLLYIGHDKGVTRITLAGGSETQVGTWDSSHYIQNVARPLTPFLGNLIVGNTTDGTYPNIGIIDTTNTITNYSRLSPSLSVGSTVKDIDVAADFSYLTILLAITGGTGFTSAVVRWNGIDNGITSGVKLPATVGTAQENTGEHNYLFMADAFGAGIFDQNQKVAPLVLHSTPDATATDFFGNVLGFATTYFRARSASTNCFCPSVLFYGSLSEDVQRQLYWMYNQITVPGGANALTILSMPYFALTFANTSSAGTTGNKFLFSFYGKDTSEAPTYYTKLYTMSVNNNPKYYSTEGNIPNDVLRASYTTQTQLFEKKVSPSMVRIYVDRTSTDSGFNLTFLDTSGTAIPNGSFSWNAATGPSPIGGRINFGPDIAPFFGASIQITPNGTNNMVIRKVEVDLSPAGK